MPNDKCIKFDCPSCGSRLIWRCSSCRIAARNYSCGSCNFSGPYKIARLLLVVKILPTGVEINLDDIVNGIKGSLKDGIELKEYVKEPLAFGLEFIKAQFTLDDAEGQMDSLEKSVTSIDGVSEFEVLNMSRMSVDVK